MRVAIVGAGPAGLAAAHTLARGGADVVLLERGQHVGGMARTLTLWGRPVETGPHVIMAEPSAAHALFAQHVGEDAAVPAIRRGLAMNGRLMSYPPRVPELLALLGPAGFARAGLSLTVSRLAPPRRESTRDVLVGRYGAVLYDAVMRGVLAKLWGRPPDEIDTSYGEALIASGTGAGGPTGPTRYPRRGLSCVWNGIANRLGSNAAVRRNAIIQRARRHSSRWLIDLDDGIEEVDAMIWSASLPMFTRLVEGVGNGAASALARLETRHIAVVHFLAEAGRTAYSSIFVADSQLCVGRVSDARAWFGGQNAAPETVITMEFWCDDSDPAWIADDTALAALGEAELRTLDIFDPLTVHAANVARLPSAIPVPTRGYRAALTAIDEATAALPNVARIGRHGTFLYDSTLLAMSQGIAEARAMLARLS